MRSITTIVLAVMLCPLIGRAQTLADRVPADAIVYIGWKGGDSLGPAYAQSHLKAVLDASQLRQLVNESLPRLVSRFRKGNPNVNIDDMVNAVLQIADPLWRHPSAFYFGGMDMTNPGQATPKIAVLCNAGAEATELAQNINGLIAKSGGGAVHCQAIDQLVVVSTFAFPDHVDSALSQDKDFQAVMARMGQDPVVAGYVAGDAAFTLIDQLVAQYASPAAQQNWPPLRDSLGLTGLKHMAMTAGFDGKNWATQVLVDAPAPRHGLLSLGDSAPLSDDLVGLIPHSATLVGAGSLDLDQLFTVISDSAQKVSPPDGDPVHRAITIANQMLGIDLQKGLLAALGAQWAYYVDPAAAGNTTLCATLINRPRNPEQLQASLTRIEQFANAMLGMQLRREGLTVQFRQVIISGATVHYLATPFFAPSWTIKDGTLFVGLYPQVVASALDRPADTKSILDNPAYQQVRKELGGPDKVNSFTFADLQRVVPEGYSNWLLLSRVYLGFGDMYGMQSPAMVIPPLDKILAEIEPAGMIGWTDDAGFHVKAITPFPGAQMLGGGDGIAGIGQAALPISILLPSLNRARETANRVKCASNLRQIGQAILLYTNENRGQYPPDLGTLVKTEDISVQAFVCPDSGTVPPPNLTGDAAANWVNAHSDYIYNGVGLTAGADPSFVVAYEKDSDHNGDGMNVLMGDGHVEFVQLSAAHKMIKESVKGGGGGNIGGGL